MKKTIQPRWSISMISECSKDFKQVSTINSELLLSALTGYFELVRPCSFRLIYWRSTTSHHGRCQIHLAILMRTRFSTCVAFRVFKRWKPCCKPRPYVQSEDSSTDERRRLLSNATAPCIPILLFYPQLGLLYDSHNCPTPYTNVSRPGKFGRLVEPK